MRFLKKWKSRRVAAKLMSLECAADYWRSEATRLALMAYNVPDMMREPMKWGRLQNAANHANQSERLYRQEASALRAAQSANRESKT